jgi:hypothetical protein
MSSRAVTSILTSGEQRRVQTMLMVNEARCAALLAAGVFSAVVVGLGAAAPANAGNLPTGCVVYEVTNSTGEALILTDQGLSAKGSLGARAVYEWVLVSHSNVDYYGCDNPFVTRNPPQEVDPGTTAQFGAGCSAEFGCSTFTGFVTYTQADANAPHPDSAVNVTFSDPETGSNSAGWSSVVYQGSGSGDFGVKSFSYNQHDQGAYDLKVQATICVAKGQGADPACQGDATAALVAVRGALAAGPGGRMTIPVRCGTSSCGGKVTIHRKGELLASRSYSLRPRPSVRHVRLRLSSHARRMLARRRGMRVQVALRDRRGRAHARRAYTVRGVTGGSR